MKTRKNNKGFSLVELIVVVAIMAVLVGVLAPAYLKYVEKSRIQKDVSAVGEVVSAIEIAMADEDINTNTASATFVITGGTELDFAGSTGITDANGKLKAELENTVNGIKLTSNGLSGKTVTINVTNTNGVVTITVKPGAGASADAVAALEKLDEYTNS